MNESAKPHTQFWPLALLHDLAACLRFYTRLPVPALPGETDPYAMPDFTTCVRMLPLAGAIAGLCSALAMALAVWSGMPAPLSAGFALAALVLATGAFHEDGLADTADGFGGGASRERKLEIMKDSRIGTYGGAALVLSLGLRWAAISALLAAGGLVMAAVALCGVAAVSRTMALWLLVALPPARQAGASAAVGTPRNETMLMAGALALAIFLPLLACGIAPGRWLASLAAAATGVWVVSRLSERQISGQTGDVAGAAQQVSEILLLAVLCGGLRL